MSYRPDWSEWILQKNNEAKQEELKKSEFIETQENLQKSAKNNALHKLFRDLAPHANSVKLFNLKEDADGSLGESDDGSPHPRGLVGFDIEHAPDKKDIIDKILENHGHFKDKGAFAESFDTDKDNHQQYGALTLHPHAAKNLVSTTALDRNNMQIKSKPDVVQDPAVGSMNLMEGSATGEGYAVPAKWRNSDPRHDTGEKDGSREYTRAGQRVSIPNTGYTGSARTHAAATSGVSDRGYDRVETGKPVKLK